MGQAPTTAQAGGPQRRVTTPGSIPLGGAPPANEGYPK
jgi:hypothetical protein